MLEDEFKHEDTVVTGAGERRLAPERVRNIFLGLNDGLVEILGAVSGFYAAFSSSVAVLVAGLTVAVAGAVSMAAGAWMATSSEAEVRATETERRRFLGEPVAAAETAEPPLASALLVGASYFAGALVPVLPVLAGAKSIWLSVLTGGEPDRPGVCDPVVPVRHGRPAAGRHEPDRDRPRGQCELRDRLHRQPAVGRPHLTAHAV